MLPKNFDNGALSTDDTDNIIALEKALIESTITVPVYFALENDKIDKMVQHLCIHIFCQVMLTCCLLILEDSI